MVAGSEFGNSWRSSSEFVPYISIPHRTSPKLNRATLNLLPFQPNAKTIPRNRGRSSHGRRRPKGYIGSACRGLILSLPVATDALGVRIQRGNWWLPG
jgi:hypothetical protein